MGGVILLGIDVETASEAARSFAERGVDLFGELDVPVTWYVTGQTLEKYPAPFRDAQRGGLIDVQSHTYSHMLLKTVVFQVPRGKVFAGRSGPTMVRGGSVDRIARDISRCQKVFRDVLGRGATALTGPWAYWRGLMDRPDILEILDEHGFRVLRTFGRTADDGHPVPLDWQPFFYSVQGFPRILEIMVHDHHDESMWRIFGDPKPRASYLAHMPAVVRRAAHRGLVLSICSHDHMCDKNFDGRTAWMRGLVGYARGLGMRFMTASQYYTEAHRRGRKEAWYVHNG